MDLKKQIKQIIKLNKDLQAHHSEQTKRYKHELEFIISQYFVLKSTKKTFDSKQIKEDTTFEVENIIGYMDELHDMNVKLIELIQILQKALEERS
jgi:hypothetical protein